MPQTIKVDSFTISDITRKVELNEIRLPIFQREFVWSKTDVAKLLDSILKSYPIGGMTLWKQNVEQVNKSITNSHQSNKPAEYLVLDGQQRITSLYAIKKGLTIGNENYRDLFIDLKADEDESFVFTEMNESRKESFVRVEEIEDTLSFSLLCARFSSDKDVLTRLTRLHDNLTTYPLAVTILQDSELNIATDVFARINQNGKKLTLFEIMCAKLYSPGEFNLLEKRKEQKARWQKLNFILEDKTVLQAMALCLNEQCKEKTIQQLPKDLFIQNWDKLDKAFDKSIDYLRSFYRIPNSKYLPYESMIIPFVCYFYNSNAIPIDYSEKVLKDYFWRTALRSRYQQGVAAQLYSDVKNIVMPLLNKDSVSADYLPDVDISEEHIAIDGHYNLNSAFFKGLLCILAQQGPKAFENGSDIILDGSELDKKNGKDNHHFFPKKYMEKQGDKEINARAVDHIANIVFVGSGANRDSYRDLPPSEYIKKYGCKNHEQLVEIMKTHLINLDSFGVYENDYSVFYSQRIRLIQNELKTRIIARDFGDIVNKNEELKDPKSNQEFVKNTLAKKRTYSKSSDVIRMPKKAITEFETKKGIEMHNLDSRSNIFVSKSSSVAVVVMASKRYSKNDRDYWFGPTPSVLKKVKDYPSKYILFCCSTPDCYFCLPYEVFMEELRKCTTTNDDQGNIEHWHIKFKYEQDVLVWKTRENSLKLNQFLL